MGKCSYHENEETKYACNECRKEFCQECYNVLDDLEKHNYLHNIFAQIPKNTCMSCTLFNLTKYKELMDLDKKDIVNTFKRILICYVIGLVLFLISAIADSGLMILGFFLCGYGAWHYYNEGNMSFEDQRKAGMANYEITRGLGGGLNVRQTTSDGIFILGLVLWAFGLVSTPIYLLLNMKKVKQMTEAYTYYTETVGKLENLTHKKFVYDKQRQKYVETAI